MSRDTAIRAADLLAFYVEAGVDCALLDEPVDRLAAEEPAPPAAPAPLRPPPAAIAPQVVRQAPPPPDAAIASAREAARNAATLDDLRALMERFDGCALRNTATRLVFADGNPAARLMLIGEAPGREEDIEGLPFVGPSGKLLDRMLAAIGLDRGAAYIANVIPWRPPGNRSPTPQETEICLPFIRRHIELVGPDIVVTLGNPSTQALLGVREGIARVRGRWLDLDTGGRTIRALPTFHPAYLLRAPIHKRESWQDLRRVADALAALPPRT